MSTADPIWTAREYEAAAQEYLRGLPPEHFMEAVPQATQREITLESLALLKVHRPALQVFNELLVQYFHRGRLRQVVPDNMARECDQPVLTESSFNVDLEPVPPLIVMEYVSPSTKRKDYKDSHRKYARELKVPYYLLFYPEKQDLRLYKHSGRTYARVPANARGRFPVAELELEVGLLDGWVRFWYRGQLLDLPAELQSRVEELQQRVQHLEASAEQAQQRAQAAEEQAEQEKQRAEREKRRAERQKQRAEQEKQRAEQEKQRAEQREREREAEKRQRTAAETEVARLRALLEQLQPKPGSS